MFRIMSGILTAAFAVGLWALPSTASAQDELKKRENVTYYRTVNLNFKPGHNDEAWEILYEKIAPAVRSMGKDFVALDWESGPWDTTLYIALDEGYGTLEYSSSPQNAAFRAALAEQEGGEEAAAKVIVDWVSHIDNTSEDLAHMHLPPPEEEE